jgi:RecB family endonuclease NucS
MTGFVVRNKPDLKDVETLISKAVSRHLFVIIISKCKVDYKGRSSSKLDWGERVILLKPDGSVLVHRKTGYDAVNWQPPGSFITVINKNGLLELLANRKKPRECLSITLSEILLVSTFLLKDNASFNMIFTEEDLCQVLIKNPDLIEKKFRITSEQKELGGGKADITGFDKYNRYTVIEVKKVPADISAVKQLNKYVSEMRMTSGNIRAIIIAPTIQSAAMKLARSLSLEYRKIDLKRCSEIFFQESRVDESLDIYF